MANVNIQLYRKTATGLDYLYPATLWELVGGKPSTFTPTAHTHAPTDLTRGDAIHYVIGNTSGTAGTWTGTIANLAAYYDGLTIAYRIGIAGASTTTLNINSLGAKTCRRNTSNLTTHIPVDSVIILTYTTISGTGYWVWSDYDATTDYNMAWVYGAVAGATIYQYKILMEGLDGKFYPLTLEDSTGTTKTISTADLKPGGQILWYYTTATVSENAAIGNYTLYQQQNGSVFNRTANNMTWTVNYPIYLKGTIQANGAFKLDNTSYTSFMTQTLPTTDDGFVYIKLGMKESNGTDYYFLLTQDHEMYIFKDGALRVYSGNADRLQGYEASDFSLSTHAHTFSEIGSKPTTLLGYGITDAVPNSTQINGNYLGDGDIILTAADVEATPKFAGITTVSSSRNLASSDVNCVLLVTGAYTLTIPSGLTTGSQITVIRTGTSTVTVTGTSGTVYLNGTLGGSKAISTQYKAMTLICQDSTHWLELGV